MIVLVFIGLKMVWLDAAFGGKFPISWWLAFIAAVIADSIILSLALRGKSPNHDQLQFIPLDASQCRDGAVTTLSVYRAEPSSVR